jgi:hypothetical protein
MASFSKNPAIAALSAATDYGIYEEPVIVQLIYTKQKEVSITFLPLDELPQKNRLKKKSDWKIDIIFPKHKGSLRIQAVNIKKIATKTGPSKRHLLGRAVVSASKYLDTKNMLKLPLIIQAKSSSGGYSIMYTRLPETPGGYMMVEVSKDLKNNLLVGGL